VQKGQKQRGDHEYDGYNGRQLSQESGRPAAAENRLTRSPEGSAHIGPLPGLQENDHNQSQTNYYMNNDCQSPHSALLINLLDKGQ
jgi:hypothetical protein